MLDVQLANVQSIIESKGDNVQSITEFVNVEFELGNHCVFSGPRERCGWRNRGKGREGGLIY